MSACDAGPTAPTSFVHRVDGETWVAVAEPAGLPDAATWLPYLRAGDPPAMRFRELRREAGRARGAADPARAAALEAEAARVAAEGIAVPPDAETVLRAIAALDGWLARAEGRLEGGGFPALDGAVAGVAALRREAAAALARNDVPGAAVLVTRAAAEVREWSPRGVGMRLIALAESRIASDATPSQDLRRARRLLRTAREALATGDDTRALKRALYALQIADAELGLLGRTPKTRPD